MGSDKQHPVDVSITEWLRVICTEYVEMPGLQLTQAQAQRRWRLDARTSEALLEALVDAGFLRRTRGGGYMLADSGRVTSE